VLGRTGPAPSRTFRLDLDKAMVRTLGEGMGAERLNVALGMLVVEDFITLLELGTESKAPLFEWPQGVTLVPPEVAAQAGPAARARGPLQ